MVLQLLERFVSVVAGTLDQRRAVTLKFRFLISGMGIRMLDISGMNLTTNVKCNMNGYY